MKLWKYLLGVVLALALLVGTLLLAGNDPKQIINPPSLLILILLIAIMIVCSIGFKSINSSFKLAFSSDKADVKEYKKAVVDFKSLRRYIYISGIIATFLGLIAMTSNYIDDAQAVSSNTAVLLICPLYSFVLQLVVVEPILNYLKRNAVE